MTSTQRAVLEHIRGGGYIASEHGLDRGVSGRGKLRFYHNATAYDARGKGMPVKLRTFKTLSSGGYIRPLPEHATQGYGRHEITPKGEAAIQKTAAQRLVQAFLARKR